MAVFETSSGDAQSVGSMTLVAGPEPLEWREWDLSVRRGLWVQVTWRGWGREICCQRCEGREGRGRDGEEGGFKRGRVDLKGFPREEVGCGHCDRRFVGSGIESRYKKSVKSPFFLSNESSNGRIDGS